MTRIFALQCIVMVGLITLPEPSFGQSDDYGFPLSYQDDGGQSQRSWDSGSRVFGLRRRYRGRSYIEESTRQTCPSRSYEPIGVNSGDTVVVEGESVRMMIGTHVVGTAPDGLQFNVTKEINGWLGAVVEVDGQMQRSWIWHKNVKPAKWAAGEASQSVREETQGAHQAWKVTNESHTPGHNLPF